MNNLMRTSEQLKFIELSKLLREKVENGEPWAEVRRLLEEMKEVANNFENNTPAKVIAINIRK